MDWCNCINYRKKYHYDYYHHQDNHYSCKTNADWNVLSILFPTCKNRCCYARWTTHVAAGAAEQ